jgi:hypothetical protein
LNQPKGHDNAIKTVSRGLNSKTTKNLSWPTKDSKLQNSEYEEYQVGTKEVADLSPLRTIPLKSWQKNQDGKHSRKKWGFFNLF